jgi:hypothetical protein
MPANIPPERTYDNGPTCDELALAKTSPKEFQRQKELRLQFLKEHNPTKSLAQLRQFMTDGGWGGRDGR